MDEQRKWTVFSIKCETTSKYFISQTSRDLDSRIKRKRLKGYKRCPSLWQAIETYGVDDFTLEVLHNNLNQAEAVAATAYEISKHKAFYPAGYNMRSAGTRGRYCRAVTARMAEAFTGRKHTEETKRKIAVSATGRLSLADHRKYIMLRMTGLTCPKASAAMGLKYHTLFAFEKTEDFRRLCIEHIRTLCGHYLIDEKDVFELIGFNPDT